MGGAATSGVATVLPAVGKLEIEQAFIAGCRQYLRDGFRFGNPEDHQTQSSVVVPGGSGPGSVINVTLPDGQIHSITVPSGAQPGTQLTVPMRPPVQGVALLLQRVEQHDTSGTLTGQWTELSSQKVSPRVDSDDERDGVTRSVSTLANGVPTPADDAATQGGGTGPGADASIDGTCRWLKQAWADIDDTWRWLCQAFGVASVFMVIVFGLVYFVYHFDPSPVPSPPPLEPPAPPAAASPVALSWPDAGSQALADAPASHEQGGEALLELASFNTLLDELRDRDAAILQLRAEAARLRKDALTASSCR